MPARNKNRRKNSRVWKKRKKALRSYIFIILLFVGLVAIYYLLPRSWDKQSNLNIVVIGEDSVSTIIIDPKTEEITNIIIPNSTQVDVSRKLGVLPIGSVWQLGINEGHEGKLLAETITKNFSFPVSHWGDMRFGGFMQSDVKQVVGFIFFPQSTSLTLADRINLLLFTSQVDTFNKTDIELESVGVVKKEVLEDESEGYVIKNLIPGYVLTKFADQDFSENDIKVAIIDSTGVYKLAEEVGKTIQVLGAKVVSIDNAEEDKIDCIVKGKDNKLVDKISKLYLCKSEKKDLEGNIDIELSIGGTFADRY